MFEAITQYLTALAMSIGLDPEHVKQFAYAHGLGSLWEILRDTYLNPYVMLIVPLWFLLCWFYPAGPNREIRKAPSISMDFLYPLFNLPVAVLIVSTSIDLMRAGFKKFLPFMDTGLLDHQPIVVQAIGAFLMVDLMFYVAHVMKHKIRWLWYFHTVHHSQRYVNALTTFRNHPFEGIINAAIKIVPIAIVGGSYPAWALFVFFNDMWSYYIHADLRTNLGPFKYILVSPQNHRFHHTIEPALIDRNFGERLTVWDWMFGTLHTGFDDYTETGVKGCEWIEETSTSPIGLWMTWIRQFVYPFRMIGRDIRAYFQAPIASGITSNTE